MIVKIWVYWVEAYCFGYIVFCMPDTTIDQPQLKTMQITRIRRDYVENKKMYLNLTKLNEGNN